MRRRAIIRSVAVPWQVAGRVLGYDGYPTFDEREQTLQTLHR